MRLGVLLLTAATLTFLGWLLLTGGAPRTAAIDIDKRQGAYLDPRRTFARIQADLERTAAGRQAAPLPAGIGGDRLEAVVDAYRLFRDGNVKAMDAQIKEVAAAANDRLRAAAAMDDPVAQARAQAYFAALGTAAEAPEPAARLLAALRLADAILFMESAAWSSGADPAHRAFPLAPNDPRAGMWLRLPCRTAIGRVAGLRDALARLGEAAGPLLSCPSDLSDLAVLEAQAKAPAMLPPRVPPIQRLSIAMPRLEPSAPPTPWDHETAVAWMDDDLDAAETVLAAGNTIADKVDYALFLHAFRPPGADNQARILALLRAVETAALPLATAADLTAIGHPIPYDGSDASLVPTLRLAAVTNAAPSYAVPCAILLARPELVTATRPVFGGDRDMFLPASGCAVGRGAVRGFPEAEVTAYMAAAEDADAHYLSRRDPNVAATLAARQRAAFEQLKLDPRGLANAAPPAQDHPYQVWGLASLGNRATERRIALLYTDAATKLSGWYTRQGLDAATAARAAKTGLFRVVWGAECGGGGAPTPSLRGMLLDKAPLADIRDALTGKEPPELAACALHAGQDPLLHVAAGHPQALALMLERGRDVEERNAFGKTALMVAAQNDLLDSARLLLERGASVNATTWKQDAPPLAHDDRSALMYAAASGSLPMIKLLLDKGADPYQADTRGRRAIDYLLGFGPGPANPVLSADERADAARLLY